MPRVRRHSDPFAHMRPDFPFQDPMSPFGNRARYPPRHHGFGGGRGGDGLFGYSDEETFDDESSVSSYDGVGGYGYEGDDWRRGMRKGRGFDDIGPWSRHHPNYAADFNDSYDSDFYEEGHDYPQPYPTPRYPQRNRRETARRASRPNAGGYNKHNHQHQQHRSSHHQHHHVHHHQYIHNCAQPISSIGGDGCEHSGHSLPALPYGCSGSMGVVNGALLPYNHQPPRRCGPMRSPRYGYGSGCVMQGGGNIPRSGMALGPPLPSQLGIPVPRRY